MRTIAGAGNLLNTYAVDYCLGYPADISVHSNGNIYFSQLTGQEINKINTGMQEH